ncbi:MAG: hypothetical protein GX682_03245 [Clostridiaceae bacterium]|nr:hypothetical protein [Clostridiaceae bacterium]
MEINDLVGKVVSIKIIEKKEKCFIGKTIDKGFSVYIEDTNDFTEKELINQIEKCIIIREEQGILIGFLVTNRKFMNDIKKIDKKLKNTREYETVKDIYLMERLKIKDKVVGLYLVDEGEIGKYYLDTVEIGTYVKKLRENNILFKENTIENVLANQIKDVVQSIDLTKKEISLIEEKNKQKDLIEKALDLEVSREITRISTIDLKQKIEENNEKENKKIIKQNELFKQNQKEEIKTIKDTNIKQELETRDKLTDMKTLGQVLQKNGKLPQVEDKNFTKIGIIESTERRNLIHNNGEKAKTNTTRYSFVAIATDGSVVPLDIEQDHVEGNNPTEKNIQVTHNGEVKQDDVLSRYKIGEGTLAVKNGEYGEIKVYHSPRKTLGGNGIEGNKSLDRELETDNVWEMKKNERDLAGEFEDGYRSVEEGYQEANKHKNENDKIEDKDLTIDDVDGEKNTKSHVHDNVNYEVLASKWGYYKEGQPNIEKAKELFEEKRKQNPQKETKEIVDMVTEELEEELGHTR